MNETAGGPGVRIDPRAPRFGQAVTATVLTLAVLLQVPQLVVLIAGVLGLAVLSRWRVDLYGLVWKHGVSSLLSPPEQLESPAPHRFAKLIGAVFTIAASGALLLGAPTVAYALAAIVAVLAGLAATTGFCLGCRMYRQMSVVQRLGWI